MNLILVVLLAAAVFLVSAVLLRGTPSGDACPTCMTEWLTLEDGGEIERTYDVLACQTCSNTLSCVHGGTSAAAYCPSCRHRSLRLMLQRQPGRLVHVVAEETCALCGYQHTRHLFDQAPTLPTNVLQFQKRSDTAS